MLDIEYNETVVKCLQVIDDMSLYAQRQDKDSVRGLLDELLKIGYTLGIDKETIEKGVYKGFVFFASMADQKLPTEKTLQYGKTMNMVNEIFSERGLDLGDYKTYEYAIADPKLN